MLFHCFKFKVHTEKAGDGNVSAKILGPGGLPLKASSKKIGEFTTEYNYTPIKTGRHVIMITFGGHEIKKSPFEVSIGPPKRSSIFAYGPGLKGGIVGLPAKFTVDTCGETGNLNFSIKGPSQAEINCQDNGDGSADVNYVPTAVGEYAVHILCDDDNIPGSPFMAQIMSRADVFPENVRVFGPGVEDILDPDQKTNFMIDASNAGNAPLEVSIKDDEGIYKPEIQDLGDGEFECQYQPRCKQPRQNIMVTYGGVAVPGSPFKVQNDNASDPSKVKIHGPGLEDCVVPNQTTHFFVDCSESGNGDLKITIESTESKKSVPITMSEVEPDINKVNYSPSRPGPYEVRVTLDGVEIPESPVAVAVKSFKDLSKIKLNNFETDVFVDCPNEFEIDTSDLPEKDKKKELQCDITGPNGDPVETYLEQDLPNDITKVSLGRLFSMTIKFSLSSYKLVSLQVSYVPSEEGGHHIGIKYDGEPLPDSPYPVVASIGSDPKRVLAHGDGLEFGILDEPNHFTIETKNAGSGGLGLAIEGPSEAVMNCVDNKRLVEPMTHPMSSFR